MKKIVLMIAVVMMAFTASFAQDRQHTDHSRDQATVHSRNTRVSTSYQSSHRYRPQSRIHRMRTRRHQRTYHHQ